MLISSKTLRSPEGEGGLGKNALLSCATARFTSAPKPVDFAVLCQLAPSCRPCIWFLFPDSLRSFPFGGTFSIGSQVSSSLPPPGRLPFRGWLQLVI
jgi:hypothetical protein